MSRVAVYIVEKEHAGIDSIHIGCRKQAVADGWTIVEPSVGPDYELWYRLCPICGEPFTTSAPLPAAEFRSFELRECGIHGGVHMHQQVCATCHTGWMDGKAICDCRSDLGPLWQCLSGRRSHGVSNAQENI